MKPIAPDLLALAIREAVAQAVEAAQKVTPLARAQVEAVIAPICGALLHIADAFEGGNDGES